MRDVHVSIARKRAAFFVARGKPVRVSRARVQPWVGRQHRSSVEPSTSNSRRRPRPKEPRLISVSITLRLSAALFARPILHRAPTQGSGFHSFLVSPCPWAMQMVARFGAKKRLSGKDHGLVAARPSTNKLIDAFLGRDTDPNNQALRSGQVPRERTSKETKQTAEKMGIIVFRLKTLSISSPDWTSSGHAPRPRFLLER